MSLDLPAYLARIGRVDLHDAPPTLDTLRALHDAHTATIPFENLDIQRGLPIRLDLASLGQKLVTERRGGYCFEQNALFAAVLEAFGFSVTRLMGRVRMGRPKDGPVPPRTHMVLRVDLREGPHLADVGFGAGQMLAPAALTPDLEQRQGPWRYKLTREDDASWVLALHLPEGWLDLYVFTLEPHHPIDYEVANHFTSTYPGSHFVLTLTAQRVLGDVRHVLRKREYERIRPDGRETRTLESEAELFALLEDTFGIVLPEGTRFRTPLF